MLIGVVALIVIGPEDLPKLFRTLGRITARARSMAREFTSAMEDAAKSSGLEDAAKTLKDVNSLTSKKALGLDALDRAAERFEKWDPLNPKTDSASTSMKPDPAAPAPVSGTTAPSSGVVTDGQADAVFAPTPATPPVSASASASATSAASSSLSTPLPPPPAVSPVLGSGPTPAANEAPGKRRLHAVRRSDLDGANDKKGD